MNSIKLVCFDLNKTLIHENTWYDLNLAMGITPEQDAHYLQEYLACRLSYIDWQKELERLYINSRRATFSSITEVVGRYTLLDGAEDVINYLQNKKYEILLLSGSIDLLVKKVARQLDIKYYSANNKFIFDQNNYLNKIDCVGDDSVFKVSQLKHFCKKFKINCTEVACVGDGDNDLELFKLTQRGITFKDSKIEKYAWHTIKELTDLKKIFV